MRNNFWKWLKRFFVLLPLISLIITCLWQLVYTRNESNQTDLNEANYDIISYVLRKNYLIGTNPITVGASYSDSNTLIDNIRITLNTIIYDFTGLDGIDYGQSSFYVGAVSNFLSWWVFVELIFLFFRFITFLISWVNSLFDNTFKKIRK